MIHANELRIGNWVNAPSGNVKVSAIGDKYFQDQKYGTFYFVRSEPIALTEEILLKAGFEKASVKDWWGGLLINMGNDGCKIRIRQNEDGWFFSFNCETLYIKCKSIHQLQNLYFALTGIELEITL